MSSIYTAMQISVEWNGPWPKHFGLRKEKREKTETYVVRMYDNKCAVRRRKNVKYETMCMVLRNDIANLLGSGGCCSCCRCSYK